MLYRIRPLAKGEGTRQETSTFPPTCVLDLRPTFFRMNTNRKTTADSRDLNPRQVGSSACLCSAPRVGAIGTMKWVCLACFSLSVGFACTASETERIRSLNVPPDAELPSSASMFSSIHARRPTQAAGEPVRANGGDPGGFHEALWSYVGLSGPRHWSEISPKFSLCGRGAEQSPVDLETRKRQLNHDLRVNYKDTPLHFVDNGHTLQEAVEPGSHILVGRRKSELVQFHYHTPSENHVDGTEYPLELHFVHKDAKGQLSVIAVMVELGEANSEVEQFVNLFPHSHEEVLKSQITVHPAALMPKSLDYYGFLGSLTTPPCTEGVRWMVLKETISMSARQIASFEHLHGANARPVQRHHLAPRG